MGTMGICPFLLLENISTILQSWGSRLKFIYSEKATKFYEIFLLLLTVCTVVKSKGKISQNFAAFSEYMNFTPIAYLMSPLDLKMFRRAWITQQFKKILPFQFTAYSLLEARSIRSVTKNKKKMSNNENSKLVVVQNFIDGQFEASDTYLDSLEPGNGRHSVQINENKILQKIFT